MAARNLAKLLPDILAVFGLLLLFYGLYTFQPWIAFAVTGVLLLAAGALMGRHE